MSKDKKWVALLIGFFVIIGLFLLLILLLGKLMFSNATRKVITEEVPATKVVPKYHFSNDTQFILNWQMNKDDISQAHSLYFATLVVKKANNEGSTASKQLLYDSMVRPISQQGAGIDASVAKLALAKNPLNYNQHALNAANVIAKSFLKQNPEFGKLTKKQQREYGDKFEIDLRGILVKKGLFTEEQAQYAINHLMIGKDENDNDANGVITKV